MRMKVEVKISADIEESSVNIFTNKMTEEIQKICDYIQNVEKIIPVYDDENIVILQPEEIYMIVSKGRAVDIYCKDTQYISKKCLYEFEEMLKSEFMRISKTTIINLKQIKWVEPSFNGMLIVLKNDKKDYISRKYLPDLKRYLGL